MKLHHILVFIMLNTLQRIVLSFQKSVSLRSSLQFTSTLHSASQKGTASQERKGASTFKRHSLLGTKNDIDEFKKPFHRDYVPKKKRLLQSSSNSNSSSSRSIRSSSSSSSSSSPSLRNPISSSKISQKKGSDVDVSEAKEARAPRDAANRDKLR